MPLFDANLVLAGSSINCQQGEIQNAVIQNLTTAPTSPTPKDGQVYYNTASHLFFVYSTGSSSWVSFLPTTVTLNAIAAPTASVSLNSQKLTNVLDPTNPQDAATKGYVDAAIQGVSWKPPVRAATTSNGTLSTAYANGQTVDGVTLATGDRILVKNQTSQADNGIYTVNASGAPTRAVDASTSAEMNAASVIVEQGIVNAGLGFVQTAVNPTIGTTSIVWVQFTSVSGYSFTSGVQISGSTVSAAVDGTTISVNGSNQLQVVSGVYARPYRTTITGNGSSATFTVTHNLGNADVVTAIRHTSGTYSGQYAYVDTAYSSTNAITLTFATAPASGATFNVVVVG